MNIMTNVKSFSDYQLMKKDFIFMEDYLEKIIRL